MAQAYVYGDGALGWKVEATEAQAVAIAEGQCPGPSALSDAIAGGFHDFSERRGSNRNSCILHRVWPLIRQAFKAPNREYVEKLEKENELIRKCNDDLKKQNAELQQEASRQADRANLYIKLKDERQEEIETLRRQIDNQSKMIMGAGVALAEAGYASTSDDIANLGVFVAGVVDDLKGKIDALKQNWAKAKQKVSQFEDQNERQAKIIQGVQDALHSEVYSVSSDCAKLGHDVKNAITKAAGETRFYRKQFEAAESAKVTRLQGLKDGMANRFRKLEREIEGAYCSLRHLLSVIERPPEVFCDTLSGLISQIDHVYACTRDEKNEAIRASVAAESAMQAIRDGHVPYPQLVTVAIDAGPHLPEGHLVAIEGMGSAFISGKGSPIGAGTRRWDWGKIVVPPFPPLETVAVKLLPPEITTGTAVDAAGNPVRWSGSRNSKYRAVWWGIEGEAPRTFDFLKFNEFFTSSVMDQ